MKLINPAMLIVIVALLEDDFVASATTDTFGQPLIYLVEIQLYVSKSSVIFLIGLSLSSSNLETTSRKSTFKNVSLNSLKIAHHVRSVI